MMKQSKIVIGIIKAVTDAGYYANIVEDMANKNKEQDQKKDSIDTTIQDMKKRLIISILFLIPLMYIAMYHMFEQWLGIPTPTIINTLFHGSQNAINFGFTQFLLLLEIIS